MIGVISVYALNHIAHGCLSGSEQQSAASVETQNTPTKPEPTQKELAMKNTYIAKFSWHSDDVIMTADFTIQNNSDTDIKDIEITCEHHAHSGTLIDSNTRTIYEIVNAHSKRTFRNFNMGFIHSQAASSDCTIQNLELTRSSH